VRLTQRNPFAHATLPRIASGRASCGAQRAWVMLRGKSESIRIEATIGARDIEGRWPVVELAGLPLSLVETLAAPDGAVQRRAHGRVFWELWGWPTPPLAWLEQMIEKALPGMRASAGWMGIALDSGAPDAHVSSTSTPRLTEPA
jgi:hypothetical protein